MCVGLQQIMLLYDSIDVYTHILVHVCDHIKVIFIIITAIYNNNYRLLSSFYTV